MIELLERLLNCSIDMDKVDKKGFIGDCVTGLDDPMFRRYVADDATEMAQLVENGEEITKDNFYAMAFHTVDTGMPPKENVDAAFRSGDVDDYQFYYNRGKNVAWIYDSLEDVEYFYV